MNNGNRLCLLIRTSKWVSSAWRVVFFSSMFTSLKKCGATQQVVNQIFFRTKMKQIIVATSCYTVRHDDRPSLGSHSHFVVTIWWHLKIIILLSYWAMLYSLCNILMECYKHFCWFDAWKTFEYLIIFYSDHNKTVNFVFYILCVLVVEFTEKSVAGEKMALFYCKVYFADDFQKLRKLVYPAGEDQ